MKRNQNPFFFFNKFKNNSIFLISPKQLILTKREYRPGVKGQRVLGVIILFILCLRR